MASRMRCEVKKVGWFSIMVTVMLLAVAVVAEAQQQKKIPRIGSLYAGAPSTQSARIEAFRQGLRDLDYVEGKNIVIERRYAEGKFDRLPDLAAELVHLKVDVIVAAGGIQAIRAAKNATNVTVDAHQPNRFRRVLSWQVRL